MKVGLSQNFKSKVFVILANLTFAIVLMLLIDCLTTFQGWVAAIWAFAFGVWANWPVTDRKPPND